MAGLNKYGIYLTNIDNSQLSNISGSNLVGHTYVFSDISGSIYVANNNNVNGAKLTTISDVSNISANSYNQIINDGSLIKTYSTSGSVLRTLSDRFSDIINVKDFGATGDGITDDTLAIQNAISSSVGGTVFLPRGTYTISNPIMLHRGVRLLGDGTFDDIANASTKIKLANNSNCSMIQTPASTGGLATHFLMLENLLFDGNSSNQTEYHDAIQFGGAFIGSAIRNVFINNVLGRGLNVGWNGSDLQIDHVWILSCTTPDYAFDTNTDIVSDIHSGLLNINHLYIEHISNKIGGSPSTIMADRGKAIRLYRVITANINDIHVEYVSHGVDIEATQVTKIGCISCAGVGDDAQSDSALVRVLDSTSRIISVGAFRGADLSNTTKFVSRITGLTSNMLPEYPVGSLPFGGSYEACNDPAYGTVLLPNCLISNNGGVQRVGIYSPTYWKLYSDSDSMSAYGYIKQNDFITAIGSNKNRSISGEKDFITIKSYGGLGDTYRFFGSNYIGI